MATSKQASLFTGAAPIQTPPPWAYDYKYNDALTTMDMVDFTEIAYPSYFCGAVDPVSDYWAPPAVTTTQNIMDTIPLGFGKYKGKTPVEIAQLAPDYIVWCEENLTPNKCVWTEELLELCKKRVAVTAAARRR